MADLSASELEKAIKDILKGADLSNLSTKKVRKQLEAKFDADLISRKKEIDNLVMKLITENEEEEAANGVSDKNDGLSEDEEVPKKKAKTSSSSKPVSQPKPSKKKSATKADDSEDPVMSSVKQMDDEDLAKRLQEEESGLRTRGARRAAANPPKPKKRKEVDPDKKRKPSGYTRPCRLSDDLAAIVGTNEMPRPEVVKTLWSIVKGRNLQATHPQPNAANSASQKNYTSSRNHTMQHSTEEKKFLTNVPTEENTYSNATKKNHLAQDVRRTITTTQSPEESPRKQICSDVKKKDPENKQFIICDEGFMKVFGIRRFKAFAMMKYLKKHITNAE